MIFAYPLVRKHLRVNGQQVQQQPSAQSHVIDVLTSLLPSFLCVGYGSSAVVYDAYYKPLNRRVAIKVIDLDMFERNQIDELRRETQVMALCKHPNVLRVNGAFVADSKLYIVTPYLSAGWSRPRAITTYVCGS
jgi:hypothetical protein